MRTLTKSYDRKIAGVAGGMAEYFELDATLMRALWILGMVVMPPMVLAYCVLAIVLPTGSSARAEYIPPTPEDARPRESRSYRRMTKSWDRWLAGVAGGIAEYFDADPVLIRALFLGAFFFGGTGLLAYIILAVLMPRPQFQYR